MLKILLSTVFILATGSLPGALALASSVPPATFDVPCNSSSNEWAIEVTLTSEGPSYPSALIHHFELLEAALAEISEAGGNACEKDTCHAFTSCTQDYTNRNLDPGTPSESFDPATGIWTMVITVTGTIHTNCEECLNTDLFGGGF